MTSLGGANIPTISAAVSTLGLSSKTSSRNNSNEALNALSTTTKEIVQQKFKENENVLSIFEAYQIVDQVHTSRILSLVVSDAGGTYAIFSMTATRLPLKLCSDLTIDKVFPLNESFHIGSDKKGSVSQLHFILKNSHEEPDKFYYYPYSSNEEATDFDQFLAQVLSAKMSMVHTPALQTTEATTLSYAWVNDYRQLGEVKQEMRRRENEYIKYKDITIYCATWNVNNKTYLDSPLHLWLASSEVAPDIYAIGLQELDTSAKALTFSENRPDYFWINKMLESVHDQGEYEELTSVRLVGMMLTIIVKRQIRSSITRYSVKTVPRGLLNTLGNKGGVAVSLQLNEANLCFVNTHLAAHMGFVEQRNEDFHGIVRGLIFDDDLRRTINDHEHIFWIGDLNYRIEEPPGLQVSVSRSAANSYEVMMPFDQLRQEMRKGNVFEGYTEGPITFRPSYKYDPGTDNYDSSEKQRAPAYCDRILWKGSRITQLSYDSIMDIRLSDHKPVYAVFNVNIKTRDDHLYKKVHEEVLKLLDKRENENQPQIIVEKTIIDFGEVRFNEMVVNDFAVSNPGPIPVEFEFKRKDPPLNDICEKWLRVEPCSETLMLDSTKSVRVKLMANADTITGLLHKIQTTNWKFDFDILILQVKNGPHIFITVTGEYKPSCFGLSVETLCRTHRPLCEYNQQDIKVLMNDETDFRVTMPREFFLLIDYLHKQGPAVENAFNLDSLEFKHAKNVQFNAVRDWLDTWSNNDFPGTPHAAAEALLMLLNLPEKPLLDPYVEELLKTNTTAEAMELVALLSSPKRNVFVHLCMFLREGIERRYYNAMHVSKIFGRVLLRCTKKSDDYYRDTRCREFMQRFLNVGETSTLSSSLSTSSSSTPTTTTQTSQAAAGSSGNGGNGGNGSNGGAATTTTTTNTSNVNIPAAAGAGAAAATTGAATPTSTTSSKNNIIEMT